MFNLRVERNNTIQTQFEDLVILNEEPEQNHEFNNSFLYLYRTPVNNNSYKQFVYWGGRNKKKNFFLNSELEADLLSLLNDYYQQADPFPLEKKNLLIKKLVSKYSNYRFKKICVLPEIDPKQSEINRNKGESKKNIVLAKNDQGPWMIYYNDNDTTMLPENLNAKLPVLYENENLYITDKSFKKDIIKTLGFSLIEENQNLSTSIKYNGQDFDYVICSDTPPTWVNSGTVVLTYDTKKKSLTAYWMINGHLEKNSFLSDKLNDRALSAFIAYISAQENPKHFNFFTYPNSTEDLLSAIEAVFVAPIFEARGQISQATGANDRTAIRELDLPDSDQAKLVSFYPYSHDIENVDAELFAGMPENSVRVLSWLPTNKGMMRGDTGHLALIVKKSPSERYYISLGSSEKPYFDGSSCPNVIKPIVKFFLGNNYCCNEAVFWPSYYSQQNVQPGYNNYVKHLERNPRTLGAEFDYRNKHPDHVIQISGIEPENMKKMVKYYQWFNNQDLSAHYMSTSSPYLSTPYTFSNPGATPEGYRLCSSLWQRPYWSMLGISCFGMFKINNCTTLVSNMLVSAGVIQSLPSQLFGFFWKSVIYSSISFLVAWLAVAIFLAMSRYHLGIDNQAELSASIAFIVGASYVFFTVFLPLLKNCYFGNEDLISPISLHKKLMEMALQKEYVRYRQINLEQYPSAALIEELLDCKNSKLENGVVYLVKMANYNHELGWAVHYYSRTNKRNAARFLSEEFLSKHQLLDEITTTLGTEGTCVTQSYDFIEKVIKTYQLNDDPVRRWDTIKFSNTIPAQNKRLKHILYVEKNANKRHAMLHYSVDDNSYNTKPIDRIDLNSSRSIYIHDFNKIDKVIEKYDLDEKGTGCKRFLLQSFSHLTLCIYYLTCYPPTSLFQKVLDCNSYFSRGCRKAKPLNPSMTVELVHNQHTLDNIVLLKTRHVLFNENKEANDAVNENNNQAQDVVRAPFYMQP